VGGAHRFEKQIPGATLVVLDDAGHYLMEDDPQRVGAELASFLAEVDAVGGRTRLP
jgi:pimeloyl-ACP methyl ester carboxylesterase